MPVEQSIHWKPLRDPHYVLASLQPADGGRRKIFIHQPVLAHIQTLARAAHGKRVTGLLLGHLHRCPNTAVDFELIESVAAHPYPVPDDLAGGIDQLLATATQERDAQVLGWYCGVPVVEAQLNRSAAVIHASYFKEPWQTVLVLTEQASVSGGAFFLHDAVAMRWFYAPFYELLDHTSGVGQAKPTCISWPQYMTSDEIVFVARDQPPSTPRDGTDSRATVSSDRRSVTPGTPFPTDEVRHTDFGRPLVAPSLQAATSEDTATPTDRFAEHTPRLTPEEVEPEVEADQPRSIPNQRAADTVDHVPSHEGPTIDDRWPSDPVPSGSIGRVRYSEDTTGSDDPRRFIELAVSEGFVMVAKFTNDVEPGAAETLWVLADSSAGILLTVASTETRVLDAIMHYNVHTDTAGLLRTPFPEHRDPVSQTIYVRETCVSLLRAKRRALRETTTLEREWKVSPTIYFLTPREWRSLATDPRRQAGRIQTLNNERMMALPPALRRQFGLGEKPDQTS
jgi:hypothetical protein